MSDNSIETMLLLKHGSKQEAVMSWIMSDNLVTDEEAEILKVWAAEQTNKNLKRIEEWIKNNE